jgi:hypothetical protein
MYRQPVNSSNIRSIGYENGTLEVEFNTGSIYQYTNVPPSLYSGLMSASSHGKYFASYIKNSFTPRKIC